MAAEVTMLLAPQDLELRMKALAVLDAILMPEFQFRYFAFDSAWDTGERMGSMRDGSGNHLYVLFFADGCFLVGFDHERPTQPAIFAGLPPQFEPCRAEPAFDTEYSNLCLWCTPRGEWSSAETPQATNLLELIVGGPEVYAAWATDYYERQVPMDPVEHCFEGRPLDDATIEQLTKDRTLADLGEDLAEIGYP